MIIASLSEDRKIEKRISITPEIAKKYISSGFDILLSEKYGEHLGYADSQYETLGVKFCNNQEILSKGNIFIQLGLMSDENLSYNKHGDFINNCHAVLYKLGPYSP